MPWDSKELRKLVEERHGQGQCELLRHPLNSAILKLQFARYHAAESARVLRESIPVNIENETTEAAKQLLRAFLSAEERAALKNTHFKAEAHLIAFAQALHSVADILAGVVYLALDLPGSLRIEIKPRKLNLNTVTNELAKVDRASGVVKSLRDFAQDQEFRYLSAYVNTTKHRSLVPTTPSVGLWEGKYGIKIRAFDYNGESCPEKWACDFIEEGFDVIRDCSFAVGQALNIHLRDELESGRELET